MKVLPCLIAFGLTATNASTAMAAPVSNATAAIKTARYVCRLQSPASSPGKWQAVFVENADFGDEWHVWFGKDQIEPVCGFDGAIVKADGSYTSCRISACSVAPRKSK